MLALTFQHPFWASAPRDTAFFISGHVQLAQAAVAAVSQQSWLTTVREAGLQAPSECQFHSPSLWLPRYPHYTTNLWVLLCLSWSQSVVLWWLSLWAQMPGLIPGLCCWGAGLSVEPLRGLAADAELRALGGSGVEWAELAFRSESYAVVALQTARLSWALTLRGNHTVTASFPHAFFLTCHSSSL